MLARRMLTLLMLIAALAVAGGCGDEGSDGDGGGGSGGSVTSPIDEAEQTGENAVEACEDAIAEQLDGADEAIALAACRDAGQDIDQAMDRARDALDKVRNPGQAAQEAALQECREQASDLPGPAAAAAREACDQTLE